jgi:hypothetical protein
VITAEATKASPTALMADTLLYRRLRVILLPPRNSRRAFLGARLHCLAGRSVDHRTFDAFVTKTLV